MPDGSMSECQHCLPLNTGGEVGGAASEVQGVEGILQVLYCCSWCVYCVLYPYTCCIYGLFVTIV